MDDQMSDEQKTAEEIAAAKVAEEDVITIGEEPPPEGKEDSSVIRKMRQVHKDVKAENRELKEKLAAATSTDDKSVGVKPTLEGCNYDTDKFSVDLEKWHEKKNAIAAQQAKVDSEQKQRDIAWQKKMDIYNEKKSGLNVPDYEDAEESTHDAFSDTQLGLIIDAADNPAVVVYALGKNSKLAKELAAITEPVKFVAAMSKLEAQMKVTKRKASTKPEEIITGSGGPIVTGDEVLGKLREEAEKTNDYTKIAEYNRQQRIKEKISNG